MTSIVAILNSHPTNPDIVLVKIPPEGAQHMRGFGPATWEPKLRAWLIPDDMAEAFKKYAANHYLSVQDSTTAAKAIVPYNERPQMPECRHCGQAGQASNPPRYCPDCGKAWEPIFPRDLQHVEMLPTVTCYRCNHRQEPHWAYCQHCGTPMEVEDAFHKPVVTAQRTKLDDPMSLADAIAEQEWLDDARNRTHAPHMPEVMKGKGVVDVELPPGPPADVPPIVETTQPPAPQKTGSADNEEGIDPWALY